MTRFTPEGLARTDFLHLLREEPAAARERLENLIADPEALGMYGEALASSDVPDRQQAAPAGWDELRRRILREGLRESAIDAATLARIAQDFDLLVELQFDLYSAEAPGAAWRRAWELSGVGDECDREGDTIPLAESPYGPRSATDSAIDILASRVGVRDPGNDLRPTCDACLPSRTNPFPVKSSELPSDGVEQTPGVAGFCDWFTYREGLHQSHVDGHFWSHWSTDLAQGPAYDPRVVLLVHHNSPADLASSSFEGGLHRAGSHADTLAIGCLNLTISSVPHAAAAEIKRHRRHRGKRHPGSSTWRQWMNRFLSNFVGFETQYDGEVTESLAAHVVCVRHARPTSVIEWTGDDLGAIVLLVVAASPMVVVDVGRGGVREVICTPSAHGQRFPASDCLPRVRWPPGQARSSKAPAHPSKDLIGTV